MQNETKQDYVIRKIQNALFNKSEISKLTGIEYMTIWRICNGKIRSLKFQHVEILFDFFKKIAD